MRRRTMIQMTTAGAMLAGSGGMLSAFASGEANHNKAGLGVQIYTLREQMQSDARRVLADVAALGYREVELFGLGNETQGDSPLFGLSAKDFAAALEDVGLRAPITHINGDAMNIAAIADLVQPIGVRHLVVAMAPEFVAFADGRLRTLGATGRDQLDTIAERLNRQAEAAKASGMGFGYHNHQMEFADLGDENAFDYLFSQADSDLVKIELDIAWALVAGADPIKVLKRYAGRVLSVHLKDYDPSLAQGDSGPIHAQLVEPGTGPTDFGPILAALDETGVAHRFVEVDVSPDPMGSVARGYAHLSGF